MTTECDLFLKLFNETIDCVIIISLKKSVIRREDCIKQLSFFNISNYIFFDAIDVTENSQYYDIYLENNKDKYILSKGELGCILSHFNVMKLAKSRYDTILILEDDFLLSNCFRSEFIEVVQNLPKKWDLVYLGKKHQVHRNKKLGNIVQIGTHFYKPNEFTLASHALLINDNNGIFEELMKLYKLLDRPVDHKIRHLFSKFNCFAVTNDLIITSLENSTVRNYVEDYSVWGWDRNKYFDTLL